MFLDDLIQILQFVNIVVPESEILDEGGHVNVVFAPGEAGLEEILGEVNWNSLIIISVEDENIGLKITNPLIGADNVV